MTTTTQLRTLITKLRKDHAAHVAAAKEIEQAFISIGLDTKPFFRIEGHIGKSHRSAIKRLTKAGKKRKKPGPKPAKKRKKVTKKARKKPGSKPGKKRKKAKKKAAKKKSGKRSWPKGKKRGKRK